MRELDRKVVRALGCGVALLLLCFVASAAQAQPPDAPAFRERPCDFGSAASDVAQRIRCGTVGVPRDYARPEGQSFELAVTVIRSATTPAAPDPVIYISGGPGEPLTVYAPYQARERYAPNRDLILVDQRGTGRSEPALCPELNQRLLDTNIAFATDEPAEALRARRAVFAECRDRALGRGIDLADFGTETTARDLDRVRRALGIERWNLYGESYGTTVAMALAALFPETLRSMVLDSIYLPEPAPAWSSSVAQARDAFFALCADDPGCATAYPNLARTYDETLARLGREPLTVPLPADVHPSDDHLRITSEVFEVMVAQLLYYRSAYATLPRTITRAHDGRGQDLAPVVAALYRGARTRTVALTAAVECRDRPRFRGAPPTADILDRQQLYGVCADWSELGPPPPFPVGNAVPTLVLAGAIDPVALPALSRHVAEALRAAHWIEFPAVGHHVRAYSTCAQRIVSDFIEDSGAGLDESCAGAPPIAFE